MDDARRPGGAPDPAEITRLLSSSAGGSADARDRLLDIVYAELHALARARMRGERADHTLGATALVHEAYVRLFRAADADAGPAPFASRHGFFASAATIMRRILIDHARARAAVRRGGEQRRAGGRVSLDVIEAATTLEPEEMLSLDEAISRLEGVDERAATVVRLRFYGGLEIAEVAAMLEVSERTVKRDWEFARAWLRDALGSMEEAPDDADERTADG